MALTTERHCKYCGMKTFSLDEVCTHCKSKKFDPTNVTRYCKYCGFKTFSLDDVCNNCKNK